MAALNSCNALGIALGKGQSGGEYCASNRGVEVLIAHAGPLPPQVFARQRDTFFHFARIKVRKNPRPACLEARCALRIPVLNSSVDRRENLLGFLVTSLGEDRSGKLGARNLHGLGVLRVTKGLVDLERRAAELLGLRESSLLSHQVVSARTICAVS